MTDRADIVTTLTEHHRELERTLTEVLRLPADDPRRRSRLKQAALTLACHTAAAERHLHHVVRRYVPDDGDRLVQQQVQDLRRAEETMKDLELTDTDSGEFDPLVRRLLTRVRRHGEHKNTALFPRLRTAAPPEVLALLGDAVRQVQAEAAALRNEVERSSRPDVTDRMQAALAPKRARTTAYRQAEQLDEFLTGGAQLLEI
ncbi:hemerythrin domain-containing protein [Streptomyces sp. NPDC002845]